MRRLAFGAVVVAALVGCGGEDEESARTTAPPPERTSGREAPPPARETVQIEGLMGTLSQDDVQRGLEVHMDRFARCFVDRQAEVEVLGGAVELAFRIDVQGHVLWVYPRRSTVGDRVTEQCVLGVASRARFPRPRGGEAEFSFPIGLEPPDDVRPPLNWDADRVAQSVERNQQRVLARCRERGSSAQFHVTAYIARGGAVMTAGASTDDQGAVDAIDCILESVHEWTMPDPGSYPAKVTFVLR